MTDTSPAPRRKTIVARLATAGCVLACLAAIPLQTAGAEEPEKLASPADIEEMAGALGYTGSKDEGFWEALTHAVADQRAAAEEQAVSEHAEQLKQAWADAAKYGRRLEETVGRITLFTEFIPPADGDIEQGESLIRTGEEFAELDGTKTVVTTYWKYGEQVGVVASVVDDGVETVTQVIEYKPDSIDVKVGYQRPVPSPGSSAAGLKPHTIDPKADGSLGRASGGQPDGGDTIEPAPAQETAGTRLWFDPIKLPDGRVITPFVEERPPTSPDDLPSRTGYLVEHPDWGDVKAEITAFFDVQGKLAGAVGSVIQGGTDTIVAVEEITPGSLGLKKGDSRTRGEDLLKSNQPSAWDPKPQSGSGSTPTGGTQNTGGTSPDSGEQEQNPGPASGEFTDSSTSDDDSSTSDDDSSTSDEAPATGSTQGATEQPTVKWGPSSIEEGKKYTAYEITNADGSHTTGVQTEAEDGTKSCMVTTADGGEQSAACPGGMTDEPTCQVDCERLAMLTALFSCASGPVGAECGQALEGLRANPGARQDCPGSDGSEAATTEPKYGDGHVHLSGCENADEPGGPVDYGDPTDPNGAEPPDLSQINPLLLNDGVTDPTGEPEEMAAGSIELDTYGTLRDPANPPGTEDEAPAPGVPTTGEAEQNSLP